MGGGEIILFERGQVAIEFEDVGFLLAKVEISRRDELKDGVRPGIPKLRHTRSTAIILQIIHGVQTGAEGDAGIRVLSAVITIVINQLVPVNVEPTAIVRDVMEGVAAGRGDVHETGDVIDIVYVRVRSADVD